jgi:MYXO-CTERM domain-containing protein
MKKLSLPLLTLALALGVAGPAAAKKGKAVTTPIANRYFVSDPNDPAKLHTSPDFQGFDRGYVEKMARPPLAKETLDNSEALFGPATPRQFRVDTVPNPYAASSIKGNVIVIEGNANTVSGSSFNHNGDGMFEVINTVLGQLGDNFDFITVWTTFDDASTAAYYLPLRNDTQGLGACNFNNSETFGCTFDQTGGLRVQGFVFMNSVNTWRQWDGGYDGEVHPLDSFDSAVYSTLGQEVAHRWGAALRFVDPRTGNVSKKLLGRDQSHWAAYVDTDASVMDGWDWVTDGDKFRLVNDMDNYSTLDLYAMGALPVAAARPFFFIDGAKFSGPYPCNGASIPGAAVLEGACGNFIPSVAYMESQGVTVRATGEKVDLTIQDIVDAEGNRCPDPDHTQKAYRQAMVLVTRPGQSAASVSSFVDEIETINATWEQWWADRTGHALTLCTNLTQECEHASASLGGGAVETQNEGFIERGTKATVKVIASASGDDVKSAHLQVHLEGGGADQAKLTKTYIDVGNIKEGESVTVPVELEVNGDYDCGSNVFVVAELVSENAETVREEYRLFPGTALIYAENFASANNEFTVNADGGDRATAGALERVDVELSCDMTKRTPERDATPGSLGAFVTGKSDELNGDTSLWSPEFDLSGTAAPLLTFDFWLEGDEGDTLRVQLSEDGKEFVDALEETEQIHGWGLGRIDIREVFGHVPAKVTARWLFAGKGRLEGGIDNVQVLDPEGQCRSVATCGCSTDGSASPQASLLVVVGMLAVRRLRRRRDA